MGEYATYDGNEIKIGTCEDCYYLRWDQKDKITGYTFDAETLEVFRFRFPFPDEDKIEPGGFRDYDRGWSLHGFELPEMEHGTVQFKSNSATGYLVSLPCPESTEHAYTLGTCEPGANNGLHEVTVHRNGYPGPAHLVQQGWRDGRLVGIAKCNGCGYRFRLEDGYEDQAATIIRADADAVVRNGRPDCREGDKATAERIHLVADRLLAGYQLHE